MFSTAVKAYSNKLVFYGIAIVVIGFFGFVIFNQAGLFRKKETLVTEFRGSSLTSVEMVTILPKDAIPAIKNPTFVSAERGALDMDPYEQVIGLSIEGDNRAYPINMLSGHEIVDDVVGGVPVAVTY